MRCSNSGTGASGVRKAPPPAPHAHMHFPPGISRLRIRELCQKVHVHTAHRLWWLQSCPARVRFATAPRWFLFDQRLPPWGTVCSPGQGPERAAQAAPPPTRDTQLANGGGGQSNPKTSIIRHFVMFPSFVRASRISDGLVRQNKFK